MNQVSVPVGEEQTAEAVGELPSDPEVQTIDSDSPDISTASNRADVFRDPENDTHSDYVSEHEVDVAEVSRNQRSRKHKDFYLYRNPSAADGDPVTVDVAFSIHDKNMWKIDIVKCMVLIYNKLWFTYNFI